MDNKTTASIEETTVQTVDSTVKSVTEENNSAVSANAVSDQPEVKADGIIDYSDMGLKDIIQSFQEMLERGDQQELYKYAEIIKAAFYKVLKREKIASGMFADKEGAPAQEEESEMAVSNNPFAELERGFKELYTKYKSERANFVQDMEKVKEDNFVKKEQIIKELQELLDKAEDVNHTFPAFRELQARWKAINNVPQSKAKEIWDSYQHLVEKFYDYIKINNEFRDLDFRKNLESKTALCEQAEALEQEPNIVNAFKELQRLHEEWKEIGPVAKEFREPIWERFKTITATINKKHQHFFENLKDEQKKNLDSKAELCSKAEEIAAREIKESNEWNACSKHMENLQEEWKKIGFASKKENQKIYDRFRAACDKFYNSKREYYSNFKSVMQDNLDKKIKLCEQAEALMESEDWKKVTDQLINLQKVWKDVGPVARKQSDVVWKRFRAACDHFFDSKAKHFGGDDEKFAAMRDFQQQYNEIGFVPFKDKDNVQTEFEKAMNSHFGEIRNVASEKRYNKFKRRVHDMKNSGKGDRVLKFERDKLLQKYKKLESDIATLENNMGFFAKSKNAEAFIVDIEKKIAASKEELAQLEEKIKVIDKQF